MTLIPVRALLAASSLILLAACGGGSSAPATGTPAATVPPLPATAPVSVAPDAPGAPATAAPNPPAAVTPAPVSPVPLPVALTAAQASRFLAQASFGPTMASIDEVAAGGVQAWLNSQFAKPPTLHRAYVDRIGAGLSDGAKLSQNQVLESFWQQAAGGEDQLRQRMAFALSQIFVVSMQPDALAVQPRGVASYYDMLGQHAFGNFRDLLEGVALHPMMGLYLSHLRNQKESGVRVPDENFAREVMQLFTIGLYQLNPDGSARLSGGQPVPTYQRADVSGLAKVFTGWSWAGPDKSNTRFYGGTPAPERDWQPMQNYPAFHSTSEKHFLGVDLGGAGGAAAELKTALDTLFRHPNVGPFIGRQLIQRLVLSNPSPAYVGRVAAAFADNGAGVRGDMRAVIRAILLDPEARGGGVRPKLREPVLRLANWMRAFNATSASKRFLLGNMDDPLSGLGQTPLRASSVFNFYRPGYVPPNSEIARAGLVAPEMQITAEPSVTGYLNLMQDVIPHGVGSARDVQADYRNELALAEQPALLVERINLLLLNGAMTPALARQIVAAVGSVSLPAPSASNATALAGAKNNRVYLAIYLAMASPEYLVQK